MPLRYGQTRIIRTLFEIFFANSGYDALVGRPLRGSSVNSIWYRDLLVFLNCGNIYFEMYILF